MSEDRDRIAETEEQDVEAHKKASMTEEGPDGGELGRVAESDDDFEAHKKASRPMTP